MLFIGAGEMIELTATHFAAQHPRRMTFANRTLERAQPLADRFLGRAITLNDLASQLAAHDIVVSLHGEHAADHRQGTHRKARCARASTARC